MKNKSTAAILAFLLGSFGAHKFYLNDSNKGLLYLIFFWTYIPLILSLIDFFNILKTSQEQFDKIYNNGPNLTYQDHNLNRHSSNNSITAEEKLNQNSDFEVGIEMQFNKDYITLNKHSLTLRRSGGLNLMLHGIKGSKDIYYKNITSIQIKEPGNLTGFIQFELMGSKTSTAGLLDAMSDENTIALYTKSHYATALKIKEYIEDYMFGSNNK